MNAPPGNLIVGTSMPEYGVIVTHLVNPVEFGQIVIKFHRGAITSIERTEKLLLTEEPHLR